METKLVKIGNSKGVIIPSKLLKILGLKEKVKIEVEEERLIVSPVKDLPRDGWEEQIKNELEKVGQPERLMPDFFEEENKDWKW